MTNEEILANAPGWATMVCMERFWQKLTANSWRSIRLDLTYESLRIMPSANSGGIRSLSDIRRIVELESKLDKVYNDLANFEGYPEEVSALRHDIERRKQRYVNILHKKMEWKKRAEAAEKRLAEVERERDEASKSLEYVKERSNKMGDNIKSNNESLCKLIDALSQSNIIIKEFKAALNRIHAECVDVLFDFAARRDSRGLILPMHHQAPEVKEAIAVFEQLRQQLNGG